MNIWKRLIRLFKADIHGVMDRMEDKALLLNQYLREMEEALEYQKKEVSERVAARERVAATRIRLETDLAKLEEDITTAVRRERDDIARMLIRKKNARTARSEESSRHLESLNREIERLTTSLETRQLQYEGIVLRAGEYRRSGRGKDPSSRGIEVSRSSREVTDAEIELELISRKEKIKGGAKDERKT